MEEESLESLIDKGGLIAEAHDSRRLLLACAHPPPNILLPLVSKDPEKRNQKRNRILTNFVIQALATPQSVEDRALHHN